MEKPEEPKMTDFTDLKEWLRPVEDPELFMSLIDLGLIYSAELDPDGKATVRMTLTSPACPAAETLPDTIKKRLLEHPSVREALVEIVWEPKWNPATMATDEIKDRLGIW